MNNLWIVWMRTTTDWGPGQVSYDWTTLIVQASTKDEARQLVIDNGGYDKTATEIRKVFQYDPSQVVFVAAS